MNKTQKSFVCLAALLIAIAAILQNFQNAQAAAGELPAATYSGGTLRVAIPYHGLHRRRGRAQRSKCWIRRTACWDARSGASKSPRATAPGRKSSPWPKRLRRMTWCGIACAIASLMPIERTRRLQGTESISQILRTPVVHILGQQSYLTGGPAAVRVIVTDSKNEAIAGPGTVRIELVVPGDRPRVLFTGRLNRRGTTEAQFRFPAGVDGQSSAALRGGHADRVDRVHAAGAAGGQGLDSADHGEAHLPAGADDPRARAGARPRQSRGGRRPQADLRSGRFARQQGLQEGRRRPTSSASRRRNSGWPTKSTWARTTCAR